MDLTKLTIIEASKGLKNGDFTSVELTKAFLNKIKEKNEEVKAFITITEEMALKQAEKADKMIKIGEIYPLTGIPCAIKDNILIKNIKCTAGSKFLEDYIATYNATVIEKLEKMGVVFLGKTNLDEFAMGSSCENSAFFPTKNPRDLERVPGGSSGGSAAAVAADLCVYALGSDTGGSIRQPASFCGITGLKPTYGTVSRYGLIAYASSLDQIGPLTKNVDDAKIVFDAIKGSDPMDSTSINSDKENNLAKLKIGVPKEYFAKGLDGEVEKAIKEAIDIYKELGAEIIEISLPMSEYALACYYIIAPAEASANLARFDGLRYGKTIKDEEAEKIIDIYLKNRTEGFGKEVKKRIMLGTYTLSSGYYDAYYKRALKVRTLIRQDFEKAFEKVDAIIGPTSPCLPFKIGEKSDDPMSMYLADIYTVSVNLAGLPAISIPCGKSQSGLPIGMHLIGVPFQEEKLLSIASLFEKKYDNK
ncbi:MAG TPA: Asp-tRNA(Asn)/Glu-tRNA(Gln) amidotransferase subunit GatA [Candidatus Pacearchaeota archaeon]|nr:Asp-tRNA(Asn)/Glu-tRNA(Gln) amidotransferase subunit GatA [Candidatus Pacearchaeota archaeon]HPR80163.1 Asp-tRNA(Asn)/Glu-tRNA(Gln) amidotransferase subunit GatA [Candidatus Pacearchaeota archaeon]